MHITANKDLRDILVEDSIPEADDVRDEEQ